MIRPATTFRAYDGSGRLGVDLSTSWRIDGHVNVYRGRDINTPGDVFSGVSAQGLKDLERASEDVRLSGQVGRHLVSGTVYNADEQGHISNVTTANPLDQPFLPYLTFASELAWRGLQVKDAWAWARASSHDDLRAAPKTPPDLVCTAAYERHAAVASTEVLLGRLPIASATRILN